MNPLADSMQDADAKHKKCPHCGHTGAGLQYAFADFDFSRVQAACLKCGVHGPYRTSYVDAVEAFNAGEMEAA